VNVLGALMVGRRPGMVEMAFAVDDSHKATEALQLHDRVGVVD
jgi:hypothetical protein